jgi:ATP-dependent Zn protease
MHSECYKKMKNIFYDEEKNCIIDKLIHLNKETVDNNINDNNLIIKNDSEIFNIYFNKRNKGYSNSEFNLNYQNIKYNGFLLNKNIYEENCSINEMIGAYIKYILYITIILFIAIILYMIRYFKKNKITNNITEFTPVKVQENI